MEYWAYISSFLKPIIPLFHQSIIPFSKRLRSGITVICKNLCNFNYFPLDNGSSFSNHLGKIYEIERAGYAILSVVD